MPSKCEQDVGSSCKELLGVKGARVGDPRLLAFMHCCAHHVPGCKGGGHQPKEREGAIILEGREQDCEQGYQTPHNSPGPAQLRVVASSPNKSSHNYFAAFSTQYSLPGVQQGCY